VTSELSYKKESLRSIVFLHLFLSLQTKKKTMPATSDKTTIKSKKYSKKKHQKEKGHPYRCTNKCKYYHYFDKCISTHRLIPLVSKCKKGCTQTLSIGQWLQGEM
jgi:hypothetical protein